MNVNPNTDKKRLRDMLPDKTTTTLAEGSK